VRTLTRFLPFIAVASLAACGGGGSSVTPAQPIPTIAAAAPAPPQADAAASATAVFSLVILQIGAQNFNATSSTLRRPAYVSQGTTEMSFIVDGVPAITDTPLVSGSSATTYALPQGQTATIQSIAVHNVPNLPAGMTYFTVQVALQMIPGNHTIGVVLLGTRSPGVTPSYVLSEGQGTYAFSFGTNGTLAPLVLQAVVASGYVQCDTLAEAGDTTGTCGNYANYDPASHSYAFTAVAADAEGYPIPTAAQAGGANEGANPFENGALVPVETDGLGIVKLSGGPWTTPGTHLLAPGTTVAGTFGGPYSYGQRFTATCVQYGTARIGLQLNGAGGTFSGAPAGSPDVAKYPPTAAPNNVIPLGLLSGPISQTISLFPQAVTVNCSSGPGAVPVI
jgi:hypothetical protein